MGNNVSSLNIVTKCWTRQRELGTCWSSEGCLTLRQSLWPEFPIALWVHDPYDNNADKFVDEQGHPAGVCVMRSLDSSRH